MTAGTVLITVAMVTVKRTVKAKSEPRRDARKTAETSVSREPLLDINGEVISDEWAAQFRGVFWGEGYLSVRSAASISVRLGMGLRSDDAAVLTEFQRRLGGSIHTDVPTGHLNPCTRWSIDRAEGLLLVWEILDRERLFPFRKRKELPIWKAALDVKLAHRNAPNGGRYGSLVRAQMNQYVLDIRALRVWKA